MLPLISINHGYKKRFRNENSGDCTVERHSNGGAFSGSTSSGSYANGCGCGCGCYSYDNAYFSAPNFSVSMYSCSYDYGSGPTSYESVNVNYPGTASYGFGSFVYGMPTSHIPNGNVPANAKPPENRKVGTAEIIVAQPNFDNYHWVDMDFWLDAQNPVLGNTGPDNPEFVYTELVGFACFRAGTLVYNDFDSCTKIEEIKVGDFVLAVPDNDPSAPPRRCRITKVLHNPPACTWKISLQRDGFPIQKYDVTGEHPFYTRNRGWIDVASLELGDICIDKDGKEVRFLSKAFDSEPVPVFNLEVENCHTYFVGDENGNSVLVHNEYGSKSWWDIFDAEKNGINKGISQAFNYLTGKVNDFLWKDSKRYSEAYPNGTPPQPTTTEQIDNFQFVIDTLGTGTPWGAITDTFNAIGYAIRGKYADAIASLVGAIPAYGDSIQAGHVIAGVFVIFGKGGAKTEIKVAKTAVSTEMKAAKFTEKWVPSTINPSLVHGCEQFAKDAQKVIGGDIVRITPHKAPNLPEFKGVGTGWGYHDVVIKDGRVYDAFTGSKGMAIEDYKKLWKDHDWINFGF